MVKDPYRYFRIEARELLEGLAEGMLALEKDPGSPELLGRLFRLAHTFKGASRVVKRTDIGDLSHAIEDLLAAHRSSGEPVPRTSIDEMLALLDQIRELLASLLPSDAEKQSRGAPSPVSSTPLPDHNDAEPSVRVAVRDLDAMLESAIESHSATSLLQHTQRQLEQLHGEARTLAVHARKTDEHPPIADMEQLATALERTHREFRAGLSRALVESTEVRNAASELRLVPAQSLIHDLERVIRDAAQHVGKDISMHVQGAHTHIDAHVLSGLRNALIHIVRNSIAHGIEDRASRERDGKAPTGQIEIDIERRGHRVAFRCRDDGRGLDVAAVRRAAVSRGLCTDPVAKQMDEAALGELLLRGGLSTSRVVTQLSGRGVGLETVRDVVDQLKGEVSLRSRKGKGTTIEILVPISLSSIPTLSLELDDTRVLIPLDSVRSTIRMASADLSNDADGQQVVVDGELVPYLPLWRVLKRSAREAQPRESAVIIESEGKSAALGVGRLGAVHTVLVRNLPVHAAIDPVVSGAAMDDAGTPLLVLAPPALVRMAATATPLVADPIRPTLPPLLVIDDSLTTRMLEQSILESAGYEVDLAVSGEDALQKAAQRRYGLFIVDVEMPGMNGFEFIAQASSSAQLREIPSILVTSLASPDDKRRGKEVGARAYIVKSEFDQAQLLETIRRLLG